MKELWEQLLWTLLVLGEFLDWHLTQLVDVVHPQEFQPWTIGAYLVMVLKNSRVDMRIGLC